MKPVFPLDKLAGYGRLVRFCSQDDRLNISHMGIFTGLFVQWQRSGFVSPFAITRRTLMSLSRIGSIATYHRCMKDLNDYGYLRYYPSFDPGKGSKINWPSDWEKSVELI